MSPAELPIDAVLADVLSALATGPAIVLEAPPGAGKTTRVPPALASAEWLRAGQVVVAEPRRLAARLSARRVASERGERVGESIGYTVRFEDVSSAATRVRYVTEGVLLRRLLGDSELRGVAAVVLDEFHERQLATDLALALVRRLQATTRPDLKLVVMSATLEAQAVAEYLDGCPRIRSEGRLYPVSIEHLPKPDERPLEKQVASAVRRALAEDEQGDILVFLPGAGEIARCREALTELAEQSGVLVLPLYGELPLDEQVRALEPAARRKVVLSTNVAETSVTIQGVTTVIDSGLFRSAEYSAWTGLPRLRVAKISRASATQRAGRAGRTRAGRVLRLYTKGDYEARREHDVPEIRRADLSEMLLMLHGFGLGSAGALRWLDPPESESLTAATALLSALGALDDSGAISDAGRRMLEFPLHPRLSRLVVEGQRQGIASLTCLCAALLGERDIRIDARGGARRGAVDLVSGPSDLLERAESFLEARSARFNAGRLRALALDARSVQAVERASRQLARLARAKADDAQDELDREVELGMSVLHAFPDRVARRRRRKERDLVLANGSVARLSELSVVHDATLLVALDVEEHRSGTRSSNVVRLASAIEPEWLLEACAGALSESDELVYNPEMQRVERQTRMSLGSVVIDETRTPASPSPAAARVLARAALEGGLAQQLEASAELAARVEFLAEALPELSLPRLRDDTHLELLERAAQDCTTLGELAGLDLAGAYLNGLDPAQRRALFEEAPERLQLPGGRSVEVHYESGKPPWIASRLQDFFGMQKTPRVARGRVPLTVQLLAPNQRAVQVTSDLESFWQKHYPELRRALMRRYPKHAWPEDGSTAIPPAKRLR
ncbi:MAG TPA: ATP-dependent helicase HrpB [Polyangiaceae bacterium]|nr:ATP-dependent helicase HrpB [Polyangiaceae bacterium]